MVTFFKNMIALAMLGVILVSSNAFAGNVTGQPTRPCAHAYRTCLAPCTQMKKDADAARKQCEMDARTNNPNGGQGLKDALAACRSAYNQAMQSVASCQAECKRAYDQCIGGQYD
jgi:hypothetical protein